MNQIKDLNYMFSLVLKFNINRGFISSTDISRTQTVGYSIFPRGSS